MMLVNDVDIGSNSVLNYVIFGYQILLVFEIEVDLGVIKIVQQFEEKMYMFYVLVKDSGNLQLWNMVLVFVNVLSKNVKILQFEKLEY